MLPKPLITAGKIGSGKCQCSGKRAASTPVQVDLSRDSRKGLYTGSGTLAVRGYYGRKVLTYNGQSYSPTSVLGLRYIVGD
jgi:hypothetical protein